MKTKFSIVFFFVLFFCIPNISAQGFFNPTKGKAVVYFTRITRYGGADPFKFFHKDKYIGTFKKQNYMRYECDPGTHLFWAKGENTDFITADLEEGGTYIIIVDVIQGFGIRVGLLPLDLDDEEITSRAIELIKSKPSVFTPSSIVKEQNEKLKNFIIEKLYLYEHEWKDKHNFKHISSDMKIPKKLMIPE